MGVNFDEACMRQALALAEQAGNAGEVPVGSVLVMEGRQIAEGWNQHISACDPSAHAEMVAIRQAASLLKNYRLTGATLYVTLEPCLMCAGAMIQARIARVVYAAPDVRWRARAQGLAGNHEVQYEGGLLADESVRLLQDFFARRRQ